MKKKDIYIFGTGGFAKEVFFLINDINQKHETFVFKGFIDINPADGSLALGDSSYPIFNESDFFESDMCIGSVFALGMGNPKVLNNILKRYVEKYEFPNLIHPSFAGLMSSIKMGYGNIITAGCIFTVDIQIGSLNLFNLHTTLGHDSVIGNCNVFNPGVNLSGGIKIGDRNLFGTNCSVLQYVTVGNDNAIGAGAMVNRNIESSKVAVGVPAKVIKDNN